MLPTTNPENLYLGAGTVLFDRFAADGSKTGFRELGNCESFEANFTFEEIEKKDDTDGARAVAKKVITGIDGVIAAVLNEYTLENLALALVGDSAAVAQASENVTDEQINEGDAIELDRWYDLGGSFHNEVTDIKQGGPALTPDTDYILNSDNSMVKILSTGTGAAVATTWSGYRPGLPRTQVQGLVSPRIEGHLRFISAANQVSGPRVQADFPRVSVRPDGALPFIGEEFGSFTLNATIEKDPNAAPGTPNFTVEPIPAAELVES